MLYFHIPFCRQACHYCDFHFSTSMRNKAALLAAIQTEIELQKDYLPSKLLQSVYFGGGTPSLLSADEIKTIFQTISLHFTIAPTAEITLEANPDDLTIEYLNALKDTPINRLSIGIQSFSEADLKWMNRAHNSQQAKTCIENALQIGFENITIDLIYGAPTTSNLVWQQNLSILNLLPIPHFSAYCLTVEPKTALAHHIKTGKSPAPVEQHAIEQWQILLDFCAKNGFEQYEISNFAKNGQYAQHNSAYWKQQPYLGLGPSAHSFDGASRQWNIANNAQYIAALQEHKVPYEREVLSLTDAYNEYIMTSLRTIWGADEEYIHTTFGGEFVLHFQTEKAALLEEELVEKRKGKWVLTPNGKLQADHVAAMLFR